MLLFYIGASVLVLLAVIFILWPLIMSRLVSSDVLVGAGVSSQHRESTNVALYKDHLADIDKSLSAGAISESQYKELKLELERNLLEDSQPNAVSESDKSASRSLTSRWLLLVLMLLLPVAALLIYAQLGGYQAWGIQSIIDERTQLQRDFLSNSGLPHGSERVSQLEQQIEQKNRSLVVELKRYVKGKPDDLQMRTLLARTEMGFANYPAAIQQFQAILAREPQASQIMAELAQAIFLQADNRVVPAVQVMIDKSLAIDSDNTVALGLAGIAAFQAQQYAQAITHWKKAIRLQGANSANSRALQNGIRSAQALLAEAGEAQVGEGSRAGSAQTLTAEESESGTEPAIHVAVSLSDQVNYMPDDTVFIYARAWQGAKIPLAITRITAKQLPINITLNNAMSMAPNINLSTAKQFEIVARLSKSGEPIAKPGDWEVTLGPVEIDGDKQKVHQMIISQAIAP